MSFKNGQDQFIDLHRITVKIWIGEKLSGFLEVDDGEIVFAVIFVDASATSDYLLELGHGLDALVEHDQFAGLSIDTGGHEFGGGGDDGIWALGKDKIIELDLALFVVAGNAHDVLAILRHQISVFIDQGLTHAFGVVNIFAKNDRLIESVDLFEKFTDLYCHQQGSGFNDQRLVEIFLVIDTILDFVAKFINHPLIGSPAAQIPVKVNANNLVWSQEPIVDALS